MLFHYILEILKYENWMADVIYSQIINPIYKLLEIFEILHEYSERVYGNCPSDPIRYCNIKQLVKVYMHVLEM